MVRAQVERFACKPTGDGTLVTRSREFRFTPAVRWLAEPLLRRRLPGEVQQVMDRLVAHFAGSV